MRYKAHVLIEWNIPEPSKHNDPDGDLEGLLSQMDEVGRRDIQTEIVTIKQIGSELKK